MTARLHVQEPEHAGGPHRPHAHPAAASPAAEMLRLQRLAGNAAVTSLVAQRQDDEQPPTFASLGVSLADVADSAVPEGGGGEPVAVQTLVEVPRTAAPSSTGGRAAIQRTGGPTVQRVVHRCPAYDGYSSAISLSTYNCAGLAHRSYDRKQLGPTTALLNAGSAGPGVAGQIKHWLWTYDWRLEDHAGRVIPLGPGGTGPTSIADFHTVAGEISDGPADPADVYSKNGSRPVYGPGTGPSWRPPTREHATASSPAETPLNDSAGRPITKVRSNYAERVVVLSCSTRDAPIQGPPSP